MFGVTDEEKSAEQLVAEELGGAADTMFEAQGTSDSTGVQLCTHILYHTH